MGIRFRFGTTERYSGELDATEGYPSVELQMRWPRPFGVAVDSTPSLSRQLDIAGRGYLHVLWGTLKTISSFPTIPWTFSSRPVPENLDLSLYGVIHEHFLK